MATMLTTNTTKDSAAEISRPPWPAAIAALIAFAALGLSCGAEFPLMFLGIGLLASYLFQARYQNVTLTKWTLRIIVVGSVLFYYWVTANKDENGPFDTRYGYSFALAAAAELTLQYWRREPTGGPRAPFTVCLSALVFLSGCSVYDDRYHYIWYAAPIYFLFFTLALPAFQPRVSIPWKLTLLPAFVALLLGGATHAGFTIYRGDLNMLGSRLLLGQQHTSVSMGMSGQPILGSSFTLRDSLTRVLRVQNLGADPYLRGMTFDSYSNRAWSPALEQRTFAPYRLPNTAPHYDRKTSRFVRMDDANSLLFAPLNSAAILPEENHSLEWAQMTEGPLRTPLKDSDPLTYDVVPGRGEDSSGLLNAPPTLTEQQRDLIVPPEIDRRVLAAAQQIGGSLQDPQSKIQAVEQFLMQNNHYSLTVDPGAGEPISNFILQHKSAHCEYFASAAVILLRTLHVPTRYVSGYFAHESDGKGWTLVRQRDAHAWAESWVEGTGWVTVDATPGDGRPDQLAGPIPAWWRIWEKMQDALGAIRNWVIYASWTEKALVFLLLILGLLIPQIYRYWQRRRLARAGFHYSRPDAALTALAARFEALLVRRGLPCPEGRTWREHLRVIEEKEELRLPPLETFVRDYGQARFGTATEPEKIAHLEAKLRALEKEKV